MIIKKNKTLSAIVLLKPLSSKSVIKLEKVDKNNIYRKFMNGYENSISHQPKLEIRFELIRGWEMCW